MIWETGFKFYSFSRIQTVLTKHGNLITREKYTKRTNLQRRDKNSFLLKILRRVLKIPRVLNSNFINKKA
jgi:hypothetical protein